LAIRKNRLSVKQIVAVLKQAAWIGWSRIDGPGLCFDWPTSINRRKQSMGPAEREMLIVSRSCLLFFSRCHRGKRIGSAMQGVQENHFASAKGVQFVHISPDEI
jgi:hypothetical protein